MSTGDEHPTAPIALPLLQPDAARAERIRARASAAFERSRQRPGRAHAPAAFVRQVFPPVVVAISVVCLAELLNTALHVLVF